TIMPIGGLASRTCACMITLPLYTNPEIMAGFHSIQSILNIVPTASLCEEMPLPFQRYWESCFFCDPIPKNNQYVTITSAYYPDYLLRGAKNTRQSNQSPNRGRCSSPTERTSSLLAFYDTSTILPSSISRKKKPRSIDYSCSRSLHKTGRTATRR